MQLILEAESTIDLKIKMTTLNDLEREKFKSNNALVDLPNGDKSNDDIQNKELVESNSCIGVTNSVNESVLVNNGNDNNTVKPRAVITENEPKLHIEDDLPLLNSETTTFVTGVSENDVKSMAEEGLNSGTDASVQPIDDNENNTLTVKTETVISNDMHNQSIENYSKNLSNKDSSIKGQNNSQIHKETRESADSITKDNASPGHTDITESKIEDIHEPKNNLEVQTMTNNNSANLQNCEVPDANNLYECNVTLTNETGKSSHEEKDTIEENETEVISKKKEEFESFHDQNTINDIVINQHEKDSCSANKIGVSKEDESHFNGNEHEDHLPGNCSKDLMSDIHSVEAIEITESNKSADSIDFNSIDKGLDIVTLSSDNLDDIIFNIDDKDESSELENNNKTVEKETTEHIPDNEKPIKCDVDIKLTDLDTKSEREIINLDEGINAETTSRDIKTDPENKLEEKEETKLLPPVLKLSNSLDILSDEEEEPKETVENKCINIDDDDDVMLIDEDMISKNDESEKKQVIEDTKPHCEVPSEKVDENMVLDDSYNKVKLVEEKETAALEETTVVAPVISDKVEESFKDKIETQKPLVPELFLSSCKKNLAEMTRSDLEEFCVLKIVESILDRSNLSEIKNKLKTMAQNIEEYKKKAMMLTKQNRDLQVVLKSVQEDQKKATKLPISPLKITRSVGMQVFMAEKAVPRRKSTALPTNTQPVTKQVRNPVLQSPRPVKPSTPQIPVPRLVPANSPAIKSPTTPQTANNNTVKTISPLPNGVKTPPTQKAEKRTHNRIQSVTVDLTDDEPPTKMVNRTQPATNPVPPVRLVPSQNLLAPQRPPNVNSPRKVYIPISGPQGQNIRPGQTIMLKTVSGPGPRQRAPPPHMVRMPQNTMRMPRVPGARHPAPLPDCMKQYQPPNWKALPPAPDLKLSKVENGIVISWKIEGYQEDSYEEIASYQLYAYQETPTPPSTSLWKKIGDVKALPLPMACTLTQFMTGYKYYFAVRAVDIRSRLGPFSLPGSILLLNKM